MKAKDDLRLFPDYPIVPQSSASRTITFPASTPALEPGDLWCAAEWPVQAVGSTGLEMWATGDWVPGAGPRPLGTYVSTFYQLVLNADTQAAIYTLDDRPGFRISLPHKFAKLRAMVYMPDGWAFLPNVAGLQYRFHWACSTKNGSRGFGQPTFTKLILEPVLAGATSPAVTIPMGARSVTIQPGVAPAATMLVRQYSKLDTLTGIATNLATERDILLNPESGTIALINGSASTLRVSCVFNYMF
jgi:hypothetical protein